MKSILIALIPVSALTLVGAVVPSAVVREPKARVGWNGNVLYIFTDTPREDQHRCAYTVTAVFTDGGKESRSGSTDPVIASTNSVAARFEFAKAISSGELNRWVCNKKN